jgi:hypothetical protein
MFCSKSVHWLYRLEKNFSWDSPLDIKQDYAFKDNRGVVRLILEHGGRITVTRGYAWNGCSPKFCFFDILFGVPDGVVDFHTGRPKTYYASLVHDALYQFVPDGLPLKQHDADRCFLKLMEATGFRLRHLYFSAVWSMGWLIWRTKRHVRKTAGTALPL